MATLIRVRDVYKSFGENRVLQGVSLDIEEGSISALIGQSGTGKSVLFKSIMGMLSIDAGKIWYKDIELTALSKAELITVRQHFGYAFQNAALFDSMTVAENLAFPLTEVLGIKNQAEIKKRVEEMLDWIELPGIEQLHPADLSGGMRKRVGVARALIMRPDVLFFDEPTTGLDPVLSDTIYQLVRRVNRELNVTCIIITHDIPAAFRVADKISVLHQGIIVADGTPEEVARSNEPIVQDFIRLSFGELKVKVGAAS